MTFARRVGCEPQKPLTLRLHTARIARMADTAAHLERCVLPEAPVPQFKCPRRRMSTHAISGLPFEHSDALAIASLPDHHDDPFDRALIAQARERKLAIITSDERFEDYGVSIEW